MASCSKKSTNLFWGLGFLSPNILGFMAFTLVPLVLSMVLAFSNWDLRLHNMFKDNLIKFVGIDNFIRLFSQPDFFKYLGNTLFLMIGIPFGIAGSLFLASMLSKDLRGGSVKASTILIVGGIFVASALMLTAVGMHSTAMTLLLVSIVGVVLVGGTIGGTSTYRTLFYLPAFTAGVAVYILWKKLYNPQNGPINRVLVKPLQGITSFVQTHPWAADVACWVCIALVCLTLLFTLNVFRKFWLDGELGNGAIFLPLVLLLLPVLVGVRWLTFNIAIYVILAAAAIGVVGLIIAFLKGRDFKCSASYGFGTVLMLVAGMMVLEFILIGFTQMFTALPAAANTTEGLPPPQWLASYQWAKPAIMIMGFWAGIGSNNMLLYLAGLSNVPQDLYEASDIDGASAFQKFWNVTWPMLAPTTFFIVIMSVIGGLQGGFEMARTMTKGGPAGSTTTLSYFIYSEGFETGRLGYSSAIAWTLFALVFSVTMFNWKFGNRYVND